MSLKTHIIKISGMRRDTHKEKIMLISKLLSCRKYPVLCKENNDVVYAIPGTKIALRFSLKNDSPFHHPRVHSYIITNDELNDSEEVKYTRFLFHGSMSFNTMVGGVRSWIEESIEAAVKDFANIDVEAT
jgi:hypothetical protein